jgi:hypothetical protein
MDNTIWIFIIIGVVLLLLLCPKKEGFNHKQDPGKKEISLFPDSNTNMWPYYYSSFPYNYKYGGAWPPGMYSRLNYRSPGFFSGTGLTINLRPGMGYKYWPRDRWIRNSQFGDDRYYNVTNNDLNIHDSARYATLPQLFAQ